MGDKKGISTIVATVLIVLITVAAVTVMWAGIYPMIAQSIFVEDINVRFEIDKSQSYTVYDPANYRLSIQVKRGGDEADVVALKFIVGNDGNSYAFRAEDVVLRNYSNVYFFAVGFLDKVDEVKLVPIYLVNGKEKEGQMFVLDQRIPHKDNALEDVKGNDGVEMSEGLVFYYSFDEAPKALDIGGSPVYFVFDDSGYNHSGWIPDYGTTNNIEFVEGRVGGAYSFDGSGDYIDFLDKEGLADETGGDKTIAFWAKPGCKAGTSIVFGSSSNYYGGFMIPCAGEGMPLFSVGGVPFLITPVIEEGVWHHYVFTVKEGSSYDISLYVDGSEVTISNNFQAVGTAINTNFYVGTSVSNLISNSFNGEMDELRIYGRVLNDAEIIQLKDMGVS